MKWHHKVLFFTFAVVCIGLMVGVWQETQVKGTQPPNLFTGTALPHSKSLPTFELTDDQNHRFNQEKLKGQWSLVFFGYTQCPDICPKTLSIMSEVKQIVGLQTPIHMYLISINPEADTPEHMSGFLSQPNLKNGLIKGLTGKRETIQELAKTIGLYVQEDIPELGHIGHSGTILVVNPQGQMQALFSHPTDPFLISQDLQRLMRHYQQTA